MTDARHKEEQVKLQGKLCSRDGVRIQLDQGLKRQETVLNLNRNSTLRQL